MWPIVVDGLLSKGRHVCLRMGMYLVSIMSMMPVLYSRATTIRVTDLERSFLNGEMLSLRLFPNLPLVTDWRKFLHNGTSSHTEENHCIWVFIAQWRKSAVGLRRTMEKTSTYGTWSHNGGNFYKWMRVGLCYSCNKRVE